MTHPNASRERGPVLGIIPAAVLVTMATSADVASGAIAVSNLANFHNGNFGITQDPPKGGNPRRNRIVSLQTNRNAFGTRNGANCKASQADTCT